MLPQPHPLASPRRNWLAVVSLVAGVVSVLLSFIAYIPFIPGVSLMSFPMGFLAIMFGWAGGRRAKQAGDTVSQSQARWGARLGCLAWIIETFAGIATVAVVIGALALAAIAYFNSTTQP